MGSVPVAIKWVSIDPWVIGWCRLAIATTLVYLCFPAARNFRGLQRRDWGTLGLVGLIFGVHWVTYFFSIKVGSAAIAAIGTIALYGIFLSFLGALFLGHRVRWFHLLALGLSVVGTLLIVGRFELGGSAMAGFGLAVLSGFLYALLPILHQRATHLPATLRTFGQYAGALLVFTVCIPFGHWEIPARDWLGLAYLSFIGTFASHTLWVFASSVLPATSSALIYYLYVPITIVMGFFILGEVLTARQLFGTIVILAASMLGVLGDKIWAETEPLEPIDD